MSKTPLGGLAGMALVGLASVAAIVVFAWTHNAPAWKPAKAEVVDPVFAPYRHAYYGHLENGKFVVWHYIFKDRGPITDFHDKAVADFATLPQFPSCLFVQAAPSGDHSQGLRVHEPNGGWTGMTNISARVQLLLCKERQTQLDTQLLQ